VGEEVMEVQEETSFLITFMGWFQYSLEANSWQFLPAPPRFSSCTPTIYCKDKNIPIIF